MMHKSSALAGCVVAIAMTCPAGAAQVWESTFNGGTADGVVDVVNKNLTKDLIGPASNGRLQITTQDKSGAFNDNDRGGRALGTTLSGNSTFSGLYRFNFSSLNQDASPQMWQQVGFIGNNDNITRQVIGVMMRHNKAGGNYFTSLDLLYEEAGTGQQYFDATGAGGFGPLAPTAIFLGNDATVFTRDLQLAISYDGASHVLTAELFDEQGILLSGNSADLDTKLQPVGGNTIQNMYNALAVTHLGWADYVAGGGDRTTVWHVDSLGYYDTEGGARLAAVPEPASIGVAVAAGCLIVSRRRRGAAA